MSVVESLELVGGVATRATLVRLTSRAAVDRALAAGDLTVLARGRYALPSAGEARQAAHRLTGVVSHLHAAVEHGWEVKSLPATPTVTVPRNRKLLAEQTRGVRVHRASLGADDVDGVLTSADRTIVDCLRDAQFDEALAVADSALRHGYPRARMLALARDTRGPGSRQVRRVAGLARGEAANPFESVLRAIAIDVPSLSVRPQIAVLAGRRFLGRPDLVDEALEIVIEADSFAWHGDRAALRRDARRYNAFVTHGWLVLRFAWEDVMHQPSLVAETLTAAVAERTQQRCAVCRAA